MDNLSSQLTIKNMTINNRVVMPPMVCFGWSDDSGLVSQNHINHYIARAKGGVGLIVIEATCIDKDGRLAPSQLGIWSDDHIPGLKAIADGCHQYGAKVIIQIHHAGNKTPESVSKVSVSSSDSNKDGKVSKALSLEEIKEVQRQFVDAAIRAKKTGLDGIEIHGAHGYLITQFMSPIANQRDDQYGGAIGNRMRFALEIVEDIKKAVGDDFIIGYRMGGNEPNLEEGITIAKALEKAGVDLLHVSAGIVGDKLPEVPENFPFNWILYCGTEIKKHVNIPVIVVNGIRTPNQAHYIMENNLADFVAIGKGLLVDAQWANKAMDNSEVKPCISCPKCQWYTDGIKCPQNR